MLPNYLLVLARFIDKESMSERLTRSQMISGGGPATPHRRSRVQHENIQKPLLRVLGAVSACHIASLIYELNSTSRADRWIGAAGELKTRSTRDENLVWRKLRKKRADNIRWPIDYPPREFFHYSRLWKSENVITYP